MRRAVPADDLGDPVEPGTPLGGARRAVLVEQVRVERPADDPVAVEVDLQHAGLAGESRPRVPDEVAQRVGDQLLAVELDGLQHVWVVADDGVGPGVQEFPSDVALLGRRTGLPLDTPVDDHDHHVGLSGCGPHALDDPGRRARRRDARPVGLGGEPPGHDHGRPHERDAHVAGGVQHPGGVGLGVVGPRAEGHDAGGFQPPHAVEQRIRAVVAGVVVGQVGDVDPGGGNPRGSLRWGPEHVLLVDGAAAVADRHLGVHDGDVRRGQGRPDELEGIDTRRLGAVHEHVAAGQQRPLPGPLGFRHGARGRRGGRGGRRRFECRGARGGCAGGRSERAGPLVHQTWTETVRARRSEHEHREQTEQIERPVDQRGPPAPLHLHGARRYPEPMVPPGSIDRIGPAGEAGARRGSVPSGSGSTPTRRGG